MKVKILTPTVGSVSHEASNKRSNENGQQQLQQAVNVRHIEPSMQTRVTVLIVDRKYSLTVELNDDIRDNSNESIGLATYSNSKPTVFSYVSIFESLWTQTELYQQIKDANEQLRVNQRLQKEFIDIAAHELRNPIQPILSLTEIISSQEEDVNKLKLLDVVVRNAKRLKQLTEDILDVKRIESNLLPVNKEDFDLRDLVAHLVRDYKMATGKKIKLVYAYDDDHEQQHCKTSQKVLLVCADKNRISQVLSNLVNNAAKFTKDGGTISVRITRDGDENANNRDASEKITISVKDNGTGIDPAIMPRLFSKFATKSNTGTGMGLGLYISKSIVEAHGGKMWAANNKDGENGAIFHFSLLLGR